MKPIKISKYFHEFLLDQGFTETVVSYLSLLLSIIFIFVVVYVLDIILRKVVLNLFRKLAQKSRTNFDDYLVKNKTFDYLAHIIPLCIIIWLLPDLFTDFPKVESAVEALFDIVVILLSIFIIRSIIRTFRDFLKSINSFKDKPIDSYIQVFMIFAWLIGIISIFSVITGKSIWTFLTALGALSAVILLIFKDTILGFVSSIQVAVNDTVRIGDWITMTKYGADGDVIEINLSSVKVQNFDKTITTIPTYYLTSDSFRNWRGMLDSGGRRIKRSLLIKTTSIKFLTTEEINQLSSIHLISDYLQSAQREVEEFNTQHQIDKSSLINGRNLSNMGVFRKYAELYLKQHPDINEQMTIMTRQLAPTAQGIPLEIYAFSNDKVWLNYENIVANIFDHLLASIPYFHLEIFELNYIDK